MAKAPVEAHWRNSSRAPRFFMFDARAAFPFLLFLLHIRLWTFVLALVGAIFFSMLEQRGFSVTIFGRYLRGVLAGKRKLSAPWWK